MSVPKNKRSESNVLFFDNAYSLYKDIVKFLLSDLGTKPISKDLNVFENTAKMSLDDRITFTRIVNEYHLDVETSYPMWLLDHYRDQIIHHLDNMIEHITYAYTLFPNSLFEFNKRRDYQSMAISDCQAVKHQLQLAISILPVNLEILLPYVTKLDKEVELLKEWRKRTSHADKGRCIDNDNKSIGLTKNEREKIKVTIVKQYEQKSLDSQKLIFNEFLNGRAYIIYDNDQIHYKYSAPVPAVMFYEEGTTDYNDLSKVISFGLD